MVTKAVLPVAGLGTRFLPTSKAVPKEMLNVVDQPAIQYVVEEAVNAGISEIVLVTHSSKRAIEDHFDTNYELESELERKGKQELLDKIRNIIPSHVRVIAVRQPCALGLGHAVLCAREVVGNDPFAVLLPDVLVDGEPHCGADLQAMINRFQETGHAQVMVEQVEKARVEQYGIVYFSTEEPGRGAHAVMKGVVEKPTPEEAPTDLAVVGRYVLPAGIFDYLATTEPGVGGEIQLTDALDELLQAEPMEAYNMTGRTFDCGNKFGYLEATLYYGLRHPEVGDRLARMIRDLAN